MGVTRLKRKDRKNKTTSRLEVQFLKLATNIELGSRSAEHYLVNLNIKNPAGMPAGFFIKAIPKFIF